MISGNATILQAGKESAYGTAGTMTRQIKYGSESLGPALNKVQESVMTGRVGASPVNIMGIRAEGSISFLARPDDLGLFLKCALGVESVSTPAEATNAKKHTFTPIGNGLTDSLPSLTVNIDKKVSVFSYVGCKINSLSFSAAPEDYLSLDVEFAGKQELDNGALATSLVPSPLKAFKFWQGKVYLGGVEMADVTSINFSYNNNLESALQTTSTGLFYKEPQPNTREITASLEMLYSAAAETFRNTFFKTDDIVSLRLAFISDELAETGVPYSLTIHVPACQVSSCSNSVGDANSIKQSAELAGIDNGVDPVLTVDLVNLVTGAY
jgi:hypothetical protein